MRGGKAGAAPTVRDALALSVPRDTPIVSSTRPLS